MAVMKVSLPEIVRRRRAALAALLAALVLLAAPAQAAEQSRRMAVAIVGDSLLRNSAVQPEVARFDKQLWLELDYHGIRSTVDNFSVDGITTAGQLNQLKRIVATRPDVVILAVGINDAFRGVPVPEVMNNLETMIREFRRVGATIVFTTGVSRPRNPGQSEAYRNDFENAMDLLTERYGLIRHHDLLQDMLGRKHADKRVDGIHPNAAGVREMVAEIMPAMLEAAAQAGFEADY
jgi:acyl-CoA thioesterase-1